MNNISYFRHLQRSDNFSSDMLVEETRRVYEETALIMKNILNDITCVDSIEHVENSVKDMVYYITNDCCTIESLTKILEHDYYTHTHSINVSVYAVFFGKYINLEHKELEELGTSALLHDLGKSKIDIEIINKNGKLSDLEFAKMKEHPALGYELAKIFGIKNIKILNGIKHHHERLDGSGYPDRLTTQEINLFAKIVAICDVFDALTTKRSYKEQLSTFDAFTIMKNEKYHLDQTLLKKFMVMMAKR